MKRVDALPIAEEYVEYLRPYCDRIEIAGSIRRHSRDVGDMEIVCIPKTETVADGLFDTKEVRLPGFGDTVIEKCLSIVKGNPHSGKYIQAWVRDDFKLDLFTANVDNFGYIYAIRVGSSDFSKFLAGAWVRAGYKGIDGFLTQDGNIIPIREEIELFELLGIPYVEPHLRHQYGLPKE